MPEDEALLGTRRSAAEVGGAAPVSPVTGSALRFIAAAMGARSVVEIGTGCGTSGLWLLRGMRAGGVLTSVDVEPEHQRLAGFKMFRPHIFQQDDDIVHLYAIVHRFIL